MTPYINDPDFTLYVGDALEVLRELPDESVHCALTSPPFYALRDYGVEGQIGLEASPEEWCSRLVEVFREVRRVLRPDGTFWLEVGDSYSGGGKGNYGSGLSVSSHKTHLTNPPLPPGYKAKDLMLTPFLLAMALRADGWWLRQAIIWHKPNAMPESATDRCTTAHSYVFLLSKSARYHFDAEAIAEPAEWARWGDQTVPKYEGTDTATGWMQPKSKSEIMALADHRYDGLGGQKWKKDGRDGNGQRERTDEMRGFDERRDRADGLKNPRSVWTIPTQPFSARALGGGASCTVSPDCPVHGDRPAPAPTVPDGEREGRSSSRTSRTDSRPAQALPDDSAPTGQLPAPDSYPGSSDSQNPSRARAASSRSSGSRRTALAPATTPPCTPSARSDDRIADTSASPESSAPRPNTPASRTSAASGERAQDSDAAQTPSRTAGTCTCNTSLTDHFATWPEALCERIIKAGCPEGGTCLDPFMGSGTTALVARRLGRKSIGIELNAEYARLCFMRLQQLSIFAEAA